ncbi:shikimate, chloroplastic [Raphidocelis subcapitata]|uniref:shikimate kinase n=1 Tax=Raphidocelis subcapitata TaxID=307507 RepID=A0A2V0NP59_9CHLO|nr:shikimate, chloroplastic [Raphidocelis subcapitata]|eukprot:GBF89384.1 shikimate, chloroplastic [Raphidocelis subcapitata]
MLASRQPALTRAPTGQRRAAAAAAAAAVPAPRAPRAPLAAAPVAPPRLAAAARRTAASALAAAGLAAPPARPPRRQRQPPRLWLLLPRAGPGADGAAASDEEPPMSEEERLSVDFDYLSNKIKDTTDVLDPELKGCSIYIIGMMGSGKSTVGRMLANTLRYAFFDTDGVIEKAHPGMSVADIFREYGEEYFRKCESQVLKELAPYKNLVVSTGGGAVTNPMNWSYMHNGIVAWLEGAPELLARRVVAEGVEKRPLLYGDGVTADNAFGVANAKLTALLEAREKYYENADVRVPLSGVAADEDRGAPAAVVMYRLLTRVLDKIEATKAEREARRTFTIEGLAGKPVAAGGPAAAGEGEEGRRQQRQQRAEE